MLPLTEVLLKWQFVVCSFEKSLLHPLFPLDFTFYEPSSVVPGNRRESTFLRVYSPQLLGWAEPASNKVWCHVSQHKMCGGSSAGIIPCFLAIILSLSFGFMSFSPSGI